MRARPTQTSHHPLNGPTHPRDLATDSDRVFASIARKCRLARIRREIKAGTYLTPRRLELATERLLEDLADDKRLS